MRAGNHRPVPPLSEASHAQPHGRRPGAPLRAPHGHAGRGRRVGAREHRRRESHLAQRSGDRARRAAPGGCRAGRDGGGRAVARTAARAGAHAWRARARPPGRPPGRPLPRRRRRRARPWAARADLRRGRHTGLRERHRDASPPVPQRPRPSGRRHRRPRRPARTGRGAAPHVGRWPQAVRQPGERAAAPPRPAGPHRRPGAADGRPADRHGPGPARGHGGVADGDRPGRGALRGCPADLAGLACPGTHAPT